MKVFWLHSGLMPAACEAMGYEKRNSCGWLESMLDALLAADPTLELCLLGFDWRLTFSMSRRALKNCGRIFSLTTKYFARGL